MVSLSTARSWSWCAGAQKAYAQIQALLAENQAGDWRRHVPLHHPAGELYDIATTSRFR